ncbi:MAG: hypothetical protein ACLQO1_10155 [Steroidobacteraceae bacterium]
MESSMMITVWSGSSPPPLEPLPIPGLAHLEVFTSRSSEDGRERYRLHVGYFADPTAAERVLPRVREIYPSAWVVPASRHRPLARLKALAMQGWTADPDSPVTPNAPLPRAALLEPAQPKPPADVALSDEISLNMGEILALLEESDSPAPSLADSLTADPGAEIRPEDVELAPANPVLEIDALAASPAAQMLSAESPVAITAPPRAASPELLSAFSRYSVEDWCAEAPAAAEAAVARSWLKRLPKFTRLAAKRRANN